MNIRSLSVVIGWLATVVAGVSGLNAQAPAPASGDTSLFRPLDLPDPNDYRAASGAPGARYWQQRADHRIQARLDVQTHRLSGSQTIRYHNNSPDTLTFVWLQVDQNIYRRDSLGSLRNPANTRFAGGGFEGGLEMEKVQIGGATITPYIYDTMARLDLPRPLAPGGTVDLAMSWSFPVPEHGSDRMGRDGALYEIAQWFPRMAVYDDVRGWNTEPYLGQGEFYREFGNYQVELTVPATYTVAATGTLQNPNEVLTSAQRERLARAARSTEQVAIITADEARSGRAISNETKTWKFEANDVHDFAWAVSPYFQWDSENWEGVQCHAFYQPENSGWKTAADMTCFSIQEFSNRWYRYPYPQATSVAGPVYGMEYPMFVMVGNEGSEQEVFETLAHEHGHEWFPMIVSSNERRYAWMDEGFNTFITTWATDLRYPGASAKDAQTGYYESMRDRGADVPMITPPDRIPGQFLGLVAYDKPSMVLHLLRDRVLGAQGFDAAFREYIRRWAFKHPTPADFFRTMENVSGRDLAWFWRAWVYEIQPLDLAITNVRQQPAGTGVRTTITLTRNSSSVMPSEMRIAFGNGSSEVVQLPVEIWYGGSNFDYVLNGPAGIVEAAIDPDNVLPDANRANNVWKPQ